MQNKQIHILPVGKTEIETNFSETVESNWETRRLKHESGENERNMGLNEEMEKDFLLWQIIFKKENKRDAETKQMKQK